MKLNPDKVPTTLDEALTIIKEGLEPQDVEDIKDKKSTSTQCHFSIGMFLRNEWSLWQQDTILVKWFKENYGIDHADDISGIILECLWNDIRGEPRKDKILSERFIEYWNKLKDNPNVKVNIHKDGSFSYED